MVVRHLERLVDALFDCNRWHHDDELGETIALVQFEDGAKIDVCLAGSRLHLNSEIASVQRCRRSQTVAKLDDPQVLEHLFIGQSQSISDSEIVLSKGQSFLKICAIPGDGKFGLTDFLTVEQLANSFHSLKLKLEIGFEL